MPCESGMLALSLSSVMLDRLAKRAYEIGALKPSARMRSAMPSSAAHCSVCGSLNITCKELNIGLATFQ